jgi:hypothetical protein
MPARAAALVPPLMLGVLVASLQACSGCHDDHPYVPYAIGSTAATASAAPDGGVGAPVAARVVDAGETFPEQPATAAPAGAVHWPLDGVVLEAPEGRVFVSAVVADMLGDGTKQAFAIVRPPDDGATASVTGELVYLKAQAKDGSLVVASTYAPPSDLVHDAGCTPVERLVKVGVRAVLVELGAQCPARPGGGQRWIAVVAAPSPSRLPEGVRLAVKVTDPPGAPSLSVDADTTDRDGDSLPDVALRVSLEGGGAPFEPGPRVSATLAWLDRPAGLSRDVSATDSSLLSLAMSAAVRARSAKEAPTVPRLVDQGFALWRAVCAEGGAPRLVGVSGAGSISCGGGRPLEELGMAAVRSYVLQSDPMQALLALDRAQRPPASHTASRTTEALGWIAPLAPTATAKTVHAVAAVPQLAKGKEPAWGALAFEASGMLLVRTAAGVVRVDPEGGDEASADMASWPPSVVSPDATARWIEAYDPCDGVALRASFSSGDDLRDVALPVSPPLGDRCAGSRGVAARALPIAWGPRGLEAIVDGVPLLFAPDLSRASVASALLDSPALLGSPRSPDGKSLVVASSSGLLVRGATRSRLLRASELDGTYGQLRDCTVSNDDARVACVRGDKAWVGVWDAP